MPLYEQAREQERGMVLGPCGVVLSDRTLVVPDFLFLSRERKELLGEEYIEGPPDLVGEIISSSSADLDQKTRRDLYARYGVRYYWLIHPLQRWVRTYELGADGLYELVAEVHGGERFSAPPFPDLTIQLSDLWDAIV